jgi:hypothetical protein
MSLTNFPAKAAVVILAAVVCAGCGAKSTFAPFAARGPEMLAQHAADVLIHGVSYTRANSREVAGWCWNDKGTDELAFLTRASVGDYEGVGVTLPADPRGTRYISCSWHTHPWSSHVAPGPSRQDLGNSMLPRVNDLMHFVLDRQGIWQYANGRVLAMCPWNSKGTNFDSADCCPVPQQSATTSYMRVERYYGRRD